MMWNATKISSSKTVGQTDGNDELDTGSVVLVQTADKF